MAYYPHLDEAYSPDSTTKRVTGFYSEGRWGAQEVCPFCSPGSPRGDREISPPLTPILSYIFFFEPLAGTACPQGEAEAMASPPCTCAQALCEAPGCGLGSTTSPLWAVGPWNEQGKETYPCWPFATDDLYN